MFTEAYPEAFSFEEFNAIRSYAKKLKYANTHLQKISSGSARVVYKIDNEKVIKIAKNKKGLAQNNIEADWSIQKYPIVAKTFDIAEGLTEGIGPFWVEMELAKKMTPNRFKQLSGLTKDDVQNYLSYLIAVNEPHRYQFKPMIRPELKTRCEDSEFMQDLVTLIMDYDMAYPGDFGRVNSYGEVIREGKPTIVLVDFGVTSTVWNDFYKVELKRY